MFENVEKKLKTYATVNFVGVIIVAIALLVTGVKEFEYASGGAILLLLLAYALIVYCLLASCWFIQAFAEITESVKRTNEILQIAFADKIAEANEKAQKDAELEAEKERIAAEKQAEAGRVLAEERRALAEEKEQRHKAYWEEHAEERKALLAKKEEAEKALKSVGNLAGKEREQLQKLISSIDEELSKER